MTRVDSISAAARILDEVVDPCGSHRLEQILLGGEMAVNRSGAYAGAGSDLIEWNAVPGRGERLPRRT